MSEARNNASDAVRDNVTPAKDSKSAASDRLWSDSYSQTAGGSANPNKQLKQNNTADIGAQGLPKVDLYDSRSLATDKNTTSTTDSVKPNNAPVDFSKQNFLNINGKNFTEQHTDKVTGNLDIRHFDDSTKTYDEVIRNKNGSILSRKHDDPDNTSERNYNGLNYTEISVDKKTGNKTFTAYDDTKKTADSVIRDKDGKLLIQVFNQKP
ncbi:MAG TPA: hypothetical protein V6C86_15005 [Oculatellaceae cyanobacterium]